MHDELRELMTHFKRGFGKADRAELELAVTPDFEWHMHWREADGADPSGKVLRGLDEVMVEIHRRRDGWADTDFRDVEERYLDDLIVQTFSISGIDEHGRRFDNAAVDLYPIRDGRIARKQTYWKYTRPSV